MSIISSAKKIGGKFVNIKSFGEGKYTSKIPVPVPTKLGVGAIIGAGMISSTGKGMDAVKNYSLGTIDNTVQNATPFVDDKKQYSNTGSVDGSLAFALHQNRFG